MIFSYQGFIKRRVNSLLHLCSSKSVRKCPKGKVTRPNKCLILMRPGPHPPLSRFISRHRLMQCTSLQLHVSAAKKLQVTRMYLQSRSYSLYCYARHGGEGRLGNLTSSLMFLVLKMDSISTVWHNVAVYKDVTTTLNKGLFY